MNTGNKILIIGVGGAGVIAADKMNLPNSKKLFIDSGTYREFDNEDTEGLSRCVLSDSEKLKMLLGNTFVEWK